MLQKSRQITPVDSPSVCSCDFEHIVCSLNLALSDYKASFKSPHWDVFPKKYVESLKNPSAYKSFRSNGMTYKLDDSLANIPRDTFLDAFTDLVVSVGEDFVHEHADSVIGNPKCETVSGRIFNYNDLFLIQFAKRITQYATKDLKIICDIGGGYGGLGAKLKQCYPSSTVVLFDLPEVNALQAYYLRQCYPDATIFTYTEWSSWNNKVHQGSYFPREQVEKYDFVILPGWCMEQMAPSLFDLVINTRSMMEMHSSIIGFYFDHIHRTIKNGGVFYCVNRYEKHTVGYPIRLRDYPFDDCWDVLISTPSWRQPHIHELIVSRTDNPSNALRKLLDLLPTSSRRRGNFSVRLKEKTKRLISKIAYCFRTFLPGLK